MSGTLTSFERWALRLPVPGLALPALAATDDYSLWERAWEIGYLIVRDEGERALATILVQNGVLEYLMMGAV